MPSGNSLTAKVATAKPAEEPDPGEYDTSATSLILRGLWAILGLAGIVLGGVAFSAAGSFSEILHARSNELVLSAVVISVALVLSALILASVLLLSDRLEALTNIGRDAEKARGYLLRADTSLAVIARHRRSPG
jgi:hypothetical protein